MPKRGPRVLFPYRLCSFRVWEEKIKRCQLCFEVFFSFHFSKIGAKVGSKALNKTIFISIFSLKSNQHSDIKGGKKNKNKRFLIELKFLDCSWGAKIEHFLKNHTQLNKYKLYAVVKKSELSNWEPFFITQTLKPRCCSQLLSELHSSIGWANNKLGLFLAKSWRLYKCNY